MKILALDPGTKESGWCVFDTSANRVAGSGVHENDWLLDCLLAKGAVGFAHCDHLAIEMIASYGMAVGREVFETCVWIGRFQQAWREPEKVRRIVRMDVKRHLCNDSRAKDPNIRAALVDLLGAPGTKKAPGGTYGVRSHAWAALGVAVTAAALLEPNSAAPGLFAPEPKPVAPADEFDELVPF